MFPRDRCGECVQFMGFYCNLCRFVAKSVIHALLSRNLFCHNLRAFMWRKIEPKSTFVEKMTNIRSGTTIGRSFELPRTCRWKRQYKSNLIQAKIQKFTQILSFFSKYLLFVFPSLPRPTGGKDLREELRKTKWKS